MVVIAAVAAAVAMAMAMAMAMGWGADAQPVPTMTNNKRMLSGWGQHKPCNQQPMQLLQNPKERRSCKD